MKRLLLILLLLVTFLYASDTDYLKKDIAYLSSEVCFGRSLNRNGIFKAENYIISELERAGLDVSLQPVTYKLNMVIETPVCVLNGDTLDAAYDYIPHPFSKSTDKLYSGTEIEYVDSARLATVQIKHDLPSLSSARRFLIRKSKKKDRQKLLLLNSDYPLISRQSDQYPRAAVQVNQEFLDENPQSIYMFNKTEFKKVRTNNIISVIPGSETPDSSICFSAHYDHMGALGDIYYPGANDNASGVAVLMSLARYYAENPPPMTLVFCFFTGEEQGLKGSWRYVRKPAFPLKKTLLAINLDMVGSGSDGYGIVGGNELPQEVSIFEDIREKLDIGDLKLRPNKPNSDHFPFTHKGVPALFFYSSGGEQPYHHPDDVMETMDWEAVENTLRMMKEFIKRKIKE